MMKKMLKKFEKNSQIFFSGAFFEVKTTTWAWLFVAVVIENGGQGMAVMVD